MLGHRKRDTRREDKERDKGLGAEAPEHAGSLRVVSPIQGAIDTEPYDGFAMGLDRMITKR
jgi:hypothetical protein